MNTMNTLILYGEISYDCYFQYYFYKNEGFSKFIAGKFREDEGYPRGHPATRKGNV